MVSRMTTDEDVEKMRSAGRLAASVLEMIEEHIVPGVSTEKLNTICHNFIVDDIHCIPAPLNYGGGPNQIPFPKSICTSVNQVVCHGIPSESKILKSGDTVNIDITVIKDGFFGDTSKMFFVGEPSILTKRLVKITQECLYKGIEQVKEGATLGDIGEAIQKHAENNRFSVVREFCGHGIGKIFHDSPQILHYGKSGTGMRIEEGMTFTIEPMINAGKRNIKILKDNWTVVTKDHKISAQWEHTLIATKEGCEILTLREEESL